MDMNSYLNMFLDESREHLQVMNHALLELEQDATNESLIQQIFRSAHTLKGMSATMGFEDMATLTHQIENVLDGIRNGNQTIENGVMDLLFESVDMLGRIIHSISEGGDGIEDVSQLISRLNVGGSATTSPQTQNVVFDPIANICDEYQLSVIEQSLKSDYDVFDITVQLDSDSMLKAARLYMVTNQLEEAGEIVCAFPSNELWELQDFAGEARFVYVTNLSSEQISNRVGYVSEVSSVQLKKVTQDDLKALVSDRPDTVTVARAESAAAIQVAVNPPATTRKSTGSKTIRVETERLDHLMNLLSEFIIDRGRLTQLAKEIGHKPLTETTERLSRLSSNMQDLILQLRMVPVDYVLNRFPRMVRDLAKELKKQVEFQVVGSDTELDRTVVEEIADPLVHLLRNAVDHGLESPAERKQKAKPETGTLTVRAFPSGNYVFIEIQDDGRGIDRTRVVQKAIERGIISTEQGSIMTDQQVNQLLFAPGFSTADKVSDISGRGVGLDVVKHKIESLGGTVSVESAQEKGTLFSVQLPLTLSIISSMIFNIGGERYAVPLSSIVETAIISVSDIVDVHGQALIHFREKVIPLIPLQKWFGTAGEVARKREDVDIMIVRKGPKLGAIMVDSFIGQQEIVVKPLGEYLSSIDGISGATILGDGQVALIVDCNDLIK